MIMHVLDTSPPSSQYLKVQEARQAVGKGTSEFVRRQRPPIMRVVQVEEKKHEQKKYGREVIIPLSQYVTCM